MNLTTDRAQSVAIVRISETRLMYPLLADFSGTVMALLTAGTELVLDGDLLAVRDVGAYGAGMAHTYLRRPLSPEVMVERGEWRVIRRRQTLDELLSLEE